MKKAVSIILIATLAVSSVAGVTATMVSRNHKAAEKILGETQSISATVAQTQKATQKATQAPTEAPTQAPTEASTQAPTEAKATKSIQNEISQDSSTFPNIKGTWRHVSNEGCTIQVVNQNGNHVDITIESCNQNASKIATSRLSLDLQTSTVDGELRGEAYFNYSDSFGSGGKGSIIVTEDKISLAIVKEFDPCASWNITAAAGDYYFESENVNPYEAERFNDLPENQQIFDHTLPCPELEGMWNSTTNGGASIQISNQNGNEADVTIELHNEDCTKISTATFSVAFLTDYNYDRIGAIGEFEYTDSFGGSGTGRIVFDGEIMTLELNEQVSGAYSIAPAAGVFTMAE